MDIEPLAEIYTQPEYLRFMPAHDREQTAQQAVRCMSGWHDEGVSH